MQYGLKEFLLFVALAAAGFCGMAIGGVGASIAISLFSISFTFALIAAFVARGLFQSRAIGFILPVMIYGSSLLVLADSEFDPYSGKIPTSKITKHAFELMSDQDWIDGSTGEPMPSNFDPYANNNPKIYLSESLSRSEFMCSAHVLWAVLFGFLGAQFAVWLHRSTRTSEANAR